MPMDSAKYSRQILFPPIGEEGQAKLAAAKTVILGCGALGSAQASLLARAGVGHLRIIDRDFVEEDNLQRQILFDEADAAERLPKATAAEQQLRRINSSIRVEGIVADAQPGNIESLIRGFDLILDGADNFETRFLLNDAAVKLSIPWVYGAVVASYGVTMTVLPGITACLSCVMPGSPAGIQETCDTAGVISPAVSWVAAMQTAEALKILCGRTNALHGSIISLDVWENRLQQVTPRRDPACHACGLREFQYLALGSPTHFTMCGRGAVQIHQEKPRRLDLLALKERLARFGPVRANAFLVQCTLGPHEITVFEDGRAIIKGTQDSAVARSIYARYVGS
ncbi:MAG: ThiF family adenylyltransferase [Acidobacteriota bacterium]|nr:ThiF family adenylyltransferase [Acidobacteriota bacterium]